MNHILPKVEKSTYIARRRLVAKALAFGSIFVIGAFCGAIGTLGTSFARTSIERKFLTEFKEYKNRSIECTRQLNVMYSVWNSTGSIDDLKR